jgi:nucleoside-diphosphate-sugar epimerase
MRVLVIGGSGFIGNAVCRRLLDEGVDVVSITRSGTAPAGAALPGDAWSPDLGIGPGEAAELRSTVSHVVSTFGSVDWGSGPRLAIQTHGEGTRNVLDFAATLPSLERIVHVSSVLVLGRAKGVLTDELDLGQSFRSWYEYGKFLGERAVRTRDDLPWRVVRFGPVLGEGADVRPTLAHGLPSVVPFMVRGYPVHLARSGEFPCYPTDVGAAGAVTARALTEEGSGDVWTWFDDAMPTLADVLVGLCSAWGVMPRIVCMPVLRPLTRLLSGRLGVPEPLVEYVDPWFDVSPAVLERLPADLPRCPPSYLEATSTALREPSRGYP